MVTGHQLLIIMLGLATANFIYAAIASKDFARAFERTYFQAIPIGIIWFVLVRV